MHAKWFKNLRFYVVAEPHEYHVEYKIYDVFGYEEKTDKLYFVNDNNPVDTIEEAYVYISGSVKWDGCSNWHFDEQDHVMLHGCCKEDVLRYGLVLAECWEMTKELCPTWWDE